VIICALAASGMTLPAQAAQLASTWDVGQKSKARLLVGAIPGKDGAGMLVAGLEVVMEPGWKTYWRNPGDAGGIPPYFDWSKSRNLKSASVKFPAPKRFVDATGTTIGYKEHVVLPIMITPAEADRPISIAVVVEMGVCLDICIPARAQLAIEVTPAEIKTLPPDLAKALDRVPAGMDAKPARGGPRLVSVELRDGKNAALIFEVAYPAGTEGADLFVEGHGDLYVPVVKPLGPPSAGRVKYALDLSDDPTPAKLAGQMLRLTMVSDASSSEMDYVFKH
jgi:DsbC/DsbD-like thiol-disulfide interchange protein